MLRFPRKLDCRRSRSRGHRLPGGTGGPVETDGGSRHATPRNLLATETNGPRPARLLETQREEARSGPGVSVDELAGPSRRIPPGADFGTRCLAGHQANPVPGPTFRGSDLMLSQGSVLSGATALLPDLGIIAVGPRRAEGEGQRKTVDIGGCWIRVWASHFLRNAVALLGGIAMHAPFTPRRPMRRSLSRPSHTREGDPFSPRRRRHHGQPRVFHATFSPGAR